VQILLSVSSVISCSILLVPVTPGGENEFTAVVASDGDWYVGYCPEIPGANGQGRTAEECKESLAYATTLLLDDTRFLRILRAN
jgi:predicted RNase H-like HicB family nuclease